MIKSFLIVFFLLGTFLNLTIKRVIPYTFTVVPIKDDINKSSGKIHLSATLSNNTKDTLKFLTMSCMWDIIYSTNNSNIEMAGAIACDKNIPILITVPPLKTYQTAFYVVIKPSPLKQKFKIAIHLNNINSLFDFHGLDFFSRDTTKVKVIWSNEASN
jgi:hypothetical protein